MQIPRSGLEKFVRSVADDCLTSQGDRIQRGQTYKNYFLYGSDQPATAAQYNKTWAYLDDLESLLYSPVSLRLSISDPDLPNVLEEAKGRAAAARLRKHARTSDTDSMISAAVLWALVKGKSFIKQMWKGDGFAPELVQPEAIGVLKENYTRLDKGMEAFTHSMLITPYDLTRLVWNDPDRERLIKKGRATAGGTDQDLTEGSASKQVIVGGLYPFQAAGSPNPNTTRGVVDWMGGPSPILAANVQQELIRLDELWVWDDARDDWATFQLIGDDVLIFGRLQTVNALAYNPLSKKEIPLLKWHHPFREFCPNPLDGYFFGRSEIVNVLMLQENLNRRLMGINQMLRREEDPSLKITGAAGVNQQAVTRFKSPGGYFSDPSPNAKIEVERQSIPEDTYIAVHENERMFDEMGGLPPIAKGRGEAGVRSQGHAETLVRMFSPRFKDRALLIERDCEALFALMLDLAKAYDDKRVVAWVGKDMAGAEGVEDNPLIIPPAPGTVAVPFLLAALDEDMSLAIDAHSSSPAFSAEARALVFDLFKIGALTAEQVVEHVDAPDMAGVIAGIERREAEKAAELAKLQQSDPGAALKLLTGGKKK